MKKSIILICVFLLAPFTIYAQEDLTLHERATVDLIQSAADDEVEGPIGTSLVIQ